MLSTHSPYRMLTQICVCAHVYYRQVSLRDEMQNTNHESCTAAAAAVRSELKRQHFINKCDLFGATCVLCVYHFIEIKRNICVCVLCSFQKPMKC